MTTTAVAPDGSYYLAGSFSQLTDFDPGPAADLRGPQGATDVYLVKFDTNGNYAWTLTWGGEGASALPIQLSVSGSAVVVAGIFTDTVDLDPGSGSLLKSSPVGGRSTFVVSLTVDGTLRWGGDLEGTSECQAPSLAIDGFGDVYLAGYYTGLCDLDPGPGIVLPPAAIDTLTGILVKLDGDDGTYLWSRTFDGLAHPLVSRAAAVAPDGNVWVVGELGLEAVIASFTPAGVVRFDEVLPNGVDSDGGSSARGVVAAADGSIYVGGDGSGVVDFDPGAGTASHLLVGDDVVGATFVLKLAANGEFQWVKTLPKLGFIALAAPPSGGVIIETVPHLPVSGTVAGIFLAKLESDSTPAWSLSFGGPLVAPDDIAVGLSSFFVSGSTDGVGPPNDFDPGPGVDPVPGGVTFLSRFAD
ncbi:MAG TPA: hypothetical protein VGP07_19020 [Polyangia bacterium]